MLLTFDKHRRRSGLKSDVELEAKLIGGANVWKIFFVMLSNKEGKFL